MLKTLGNTESMTNHEKGQVGFSGDSRARCNGNKLDGNKINGDKVGDNKVKKKVQKLSKSKNLSKSKKTLESNFFIFRARLAFIKLWKIFIKAPIFYHFDSEHHIRIEMDVSNYTIHGVLSQLIFKISSQ